MPHKDPEKRKAYMREYDRMRREKRKAYAKEYREKNKDTLNKHSREYYSENKEKQNQNSREYYQKNKDKISERRKQRRNNPVERKKILKSLKKTYYQKQDGFYRLYYIQEEHYIGLTKQSLHDRRNKHLAISMLCEDALEEVARFTDQKQALKAERFCHEVLGYNGSRKQSYLLNKKLNNY